MKVSVPGEAAQDRKLPSPKNLAFSAPVFKSQTTSVWSSEADMARRPSAVTATALTQLVWATNVRSSTPLSKSQILSVWSSEAEITRRLSVVSVTAFTDPVWPVRLRISAPLSKSQTFSVGS